MIKDLRVSAYLVPADERFEAVAVILVEVAAGAQTGLGYSCAPAAAAQLANENFRPFVVGANVMDPAAITARLQHETRQLGRVGLVAAAISAVDLALHDAKAKILDLPLVTMLGQTRDDVEVYASFGLSMDEEAAIPTRLQAALAEGCRAVKIALGTDRLRDRARIVAARGAAGDSDLMIDANGALSVAEALDVAAVSKDQGISWFEEPVSADDFEGLHQVRERVPAGIKIAAGEHGVSTSYFSRMLAAGAVHVLQADVTRCGGITGFLRAAALCDATRTDLASHGVPAAHLHVACATHRLQLQEWPLEVVRAEHMLFEGAPRLRDGRIAPDTSRPGMGLTLKIRDAERYAA